ncbi:MAG TPA: DinB family protein [Longimicrobiaceae bacterium]|nr:DinB family protein [Longimicrobiaceae bacterium]
MTETERIADQLERSYDGDAWWGTPLREALRGITAEQASRRPLERAHTAWEIALHAAAWIREVARRVRTGLAREPEPADWPEPGEPTQARWEAALAELDAAHRELVDAVRRMPPERLDATLGDERDRPLGSGVTLYVLLHGLAQHNAAHAAQVSLLRKPLG